MRAYMEANAGKCTVGVRERAPSIVKRLPYGPGREDDVGLLVLRCQTAREVDPPRSRDVASG